MSLVHYIKGRIINILLYLSSLLFVVMALSIFDVYRDLSVMIIGVLTTTGLIIFMYNFYQTNCFFKRLKNNVDLLDKKYLVHEMINQPSYYEGELFYSILADINKAMMDDLNVYKFKTTDFKEYLELWVHEIKMPLASTRLIIENNKDNIPNEIVEEINRVEALVEQVLFYARSEHVEKDYTIKTYDLEGIVKKVIVENRRSFIYKKINLELSDLDVEVNTDSKWMIFILNQILSNSIKYCEGENACVKIYAKTREESVILYIEDNGIGISSYDINKVFDKGFTGENGRKKYNATGIGLYLCKNLCEKLHHHIEIESKINEGTTVSIAFPKGSLHNIVN